MELEEQQQKTWAWEADHYGVGINFGMNSNSGLWENCFWFCVSGLDF